MQQVRKHVRLVPSSRASPKSAPAASNGPGSPRRSVPLYMPQGSASASSRERLFSDVHIMAAAVDAHADFHRVLKNLAMREFAYHHLLAHPDVLRLPSRPWLRGLPWAAPCGSHGVGLGSARRDAAALRAWHTARTGYPLVDASLRCLQHTGCVRTFVCIACCWCDNPPQRLRCV